MEGIVVKDRNSNFKDTKIDKSAVLKFYIHFNTGTNSFIAIAADTCGSYWPGRNIVRLKSAHGQY